MNQNQLNHDLDILETMVDELGLGGVLDLLSEVCQAKAAHAAEHWQDTREAKAWQGIGEAIERLARGTRL